VQGSPVEFNKVTVFFEKGPEQVVDIREQIQAGGKTPVVGVPIANHDNNQHAANENLRLQNLWDGIETCAALLTRLGHVWR